MSLDDTTDGLSFGAPYYCRTQLGNRETVKYFEFFRDHTCRCAYLPPTMEWLGWEGDVDLVGGRGTYHINGELIEGTIDYGDSRLTLSGTILSGNCLSLTIDDLDGRTEIYRWLGDRSRAPSTQAPEMSNEELADVLPRLAQRIEGLYGFRQVLPPGPQAGQGGVFTVQYLTVAFAVAIRKRAQLVLTAGLLLDVPFGDFLLRDLNEINGTTLIFGRLFGKKYESAQFGSVLLQRSFTARI